MSKRSEQRKASQSHRQRKVTKSSQTTKQANQVKAGVRYADRRFKLIERLNYVLSNPKDPVTKEPIFEMEYRLQARRHMAKLVAGETALNGDREQKSGNDIRSWNEKSVKAAFGRQKTKGKSTPPKGW